MGDKWTLRRSISKSLLCIRRCIYFLFCICNVSKYYFLFVWKANKVKVGEYGVFMNDFHLCTLESAWSGLVSMSVVPGPLKLFTFGASTTSSGRLFQGVTTLWANENFLILSLQCFFLIFFGCPLVLPMLSISNS